MHVEIAGVRLVRSRPHSVVVLGGGRGGEGSHRPIMIPSVLRPSGLLERCWPARRRGHLANRAVTYANRAVTYLRSSADESSLGLRLGTHPVTTAFLQSSVVELATRTRRLHGRESLDSPKCQMSTGGQTLGRRHIVQSPQLRLEKVIREIRGRSASTRFAWRT